jgi:predicted RNA-binding Zn-ribbon protein involved in translation (DUF1610 family)
MPSHTNPDLKCPECGRNEVTRAHWHFLDYLLTLVGLQPFRCMACGAHFRLRPASGR